MIKEGLFVVSADVVDIGRAEVTDSGLNRIGEAGVYKEQSIATSVTHEEIMNTTFLKNSAGTLGGR